MASRVFNFSAGPCTLPVPILEKAAAEMLNWNGSGMGVIEMSHRGSHFMSIYKQTIADLRALMNIPENYKIMFFQGGATLQNACIPMNLLGDKETANYLVSGVWSTKTFEEAKKYCTPHCVATSKESGFTTVPEVEDWNIDPNGAYFHFCSNETINGTERLLTEEILSKIPEGMPIVCDMSSNFLSVDVDVSKFGVIYAGAQKNVGPSGVTIVIAREDLLGNEKPITPSMMSWKQNAANDSMLNTPPCYAIYMCGLMLDWVKNGGGIAAQHELSLGKSKTLYDAFEASEGFYVSKTNPKYRSRMNLPFFIKGGNEELEAKFKKEASAAGFVELSGHRSVGGLRASIYNGMTQEGVDKLVEFMNTFRSANS